MLWKSHGDAACIAKDDFKEYFSGQDHGFAIILTGAKTLTGRPTFKIITVRSRCCGSSAACSPTCATSSPIAFIVALSCPTPLLVWVPGRSKSSPARRAPERSRPNLDVGSSSVHSPGSAATDDLPKTSRQPSPARRLGFSSQASVCSPAD
jgi:hypothetical protein